MGKFAILGPAEEGAGGFAGEDDVGAGVPAFQPRGAEGVVTKEKIEDGVFLAAGGAGLVRIGPHTHAGLVGGLAGEPVGFGEDDGSSGGSGDGHAWEAGVAGSTRTLLREKEPAEHGGAAGAGDGGGVAGEGVATLAGEPREEEGLDPVGGDTEGVSWIDGAGGEAGAKGLEEDGIAGATAADEDIGPGEVREGADGGGDRLGGEGDECGLHVGGGGRRGQGGEVALEPGEGELFGAGALWRGVGEVGLGEESGEEGGQDLAAGGEGAVAVHGRVEDAARPGVEERVARAGVEAEERRGGRGGERGEVGDAANVDDDAVAVGGAEDGGVKGRNERRALAAEGEVFATEIGDDGDAGVGGDHVGIADLEGERGREARTVADGLAVATDGADGGVGDAGGGEELVDGLGEEAAEGDVGAAEAVDFVFARDAEGEQFGAEGGREGERVGGDEARLRIEAHEGNVDAVDTGAGEGAHVELGGGRGDG